MVWVKVMEIDDKGRVNLSMKDVKPEEKVKSIRSETEKKGFSAKRAEAFFLFFLSYPVGS